MSHYLEQVVSVCEGLGCNRTELLAPLPFDNTDLGIKMVRHDAVCLAHLYQRAEELTGARDIGARIGARFTTNALSVIGQLLPFCRDFRMSIAMVERYRPLIQSFAVSKLVCDGQEASLAWTYNVEDHTVFRQATEAIYAGFAHGAKWLLWNNDAKPFRIEFSHDCATTEAAYEEIYGCQVLFGRAQDRMVFDKNFLDMQVPTQNPDVVATMTANLDAALIKLADDDAFLYRAEASIREQIRAGDIALTTTAADLGYTERHFRYLLKKNNTTFRQIVERMRKEKCERAIAEGKPFSMIAQILGFHDQSAFNRAFKNWYGTTPTEHKRLNANNSAI